MWLDFFKSINCYFYIDFNVPDCVRTTLGSGDHESDREMNWHEMIVSPLPAAELLAASRRDQQSFRI